MVDNERAEELAAENKQYREEVDNLRRDIEQLRGDLKSLLDTTVKQTRGHAQEMKENITTHVNNQMQSMEECIQDRPLQSVLISFAAGLIFGRIFLSR